jgi:hypothetical protein
MTLAPPVLTPLFTAEVALGAPIELGRDAKGVRRLIPILSGRFTGERMSGEILPGGADWQLVRDDGVAEIEARYGFRTDDGALVSVTSSGFRHGPPQVLAAIAAGEQVDPASYYFRTRLTFAPGRDDYAWLGRMVALAAAARRQAAVEIAAFEVG